MAGTIVAAIKSKLVEMLQQRPGLGGVQITYGFPGQANVKRESIWLEGSQADVNFAAMRANRKSRNEDATITLVVHVETNQGFEASDTRVCALGQEVEECIADNTVLDHTISGLSWLGVDHWGLRQLAGEDAIGLGSQLVYTLKYKSRLL